MLALVRIALRRPYTFVVLALLILIAGTLSAAFLFGTIDQIVSFASTPVIGELAMLVLAIVLLRLMPQGITGRFFRNST